MDSKQYSDMWCYNSDVLIQAKFLSTIWVLAPNVCNTNGIVVSRVTCRGIDFPPYRPDIPPSHTISYTDIDGRA